MRIAVATLVLCFALTGVAEAKAFRGETSQGRRASLVVDEDGLVARIRISYSAPCARRPAFRFMNVMRLEPPYERSTPDEVVEKVEVNERLSGGGRNRQTTTLTAHRTLDLDGNESWSGTFRTNAVLTRNGKRLDTCTLRRVTWTASRVGAPPPAPAPVPPPEPKPEPQS